MENFTLPNDAPTGDLPKKFLSKKIFFYTLGLFAIIVAFYYLFLSAPPDFPLNAIVKIEPGMSLRGVSSILEKEHIIRSRIAFESFAIIFGGEKHIISADYLFKDKIPVFEVARRIARGEHQMAPVAVTIPEGFNINQIADTVAPALYNFDKSEFLLDAGKLEGYLFPDTYFFLTNADEQSVIKSMSSNFDKKITPLLPDIASSGKTEKDIIKMASVIEGEAKGDADRAVISGILWKRISIGMPLQVDVSPETYKTRGLPKNPIDNPGLPAIISAIHPTSSPYLYYLHDKNGVVHYAKTLAEHNRNILKYLK